MPGCAIPLACEAKGSWVFEAKQSNFYETPTPCRDSRLVRFSASKRDVRSIHPADLDCPGHFCG